MTSRRDLAASLLAVAAACTAATSAPGNAAPAAPLPASPAMPARTGSVSPSVTPADAASALPSPASTGAVVGSAAATSPITAATVLVAVDDGPATDRPAYARVDQRVVLYAALVATASATGARTLFTDAPRPKLTTRGLRGLPVAPLAAAPRASLAWARIEPTSNNLSNGDGSTFHYEPITYAATPLPATDSASSRVADVRPTLTPDHTAGTGVGTMRYQLVATQGERSIASPGIDARRGGSSGGLTDAVARVSIRRDDTFLGYLTEMFNQPYIWASAGSSDVAHQSEHLEGSDCADLMVYGARRMGLRVAYTWTGGLPDITQRLAAGARGPDGIYRDATGAPLPFTRPGDLILFTRHVGALAEDHGTPGVLDDQDVIIHTLFDSPKWQAIADTGYADTPVELRRFRAR